MKAIVFSIILGLFLLGGASTAAAAKKSPRKTHHGTQYGSYKMTVYYVPREADYEGKAAFIHAAKINGTGRRANGRLIHCENGSCKPQKQNVVRGSEGEPLRALHTIAVDPRKIAMGSRVLIQEFVGLKLSDGSIHDGIFQALDKGGRIRGRHVDIFTDTHKIWRAIKGNFPTDKKGIRRITISPIPPKT